MAACSCNLSIQQVKKKNKKKKLDISFWNYSYFERCQWSEWTVLSASCTIMLAKSTALCWNMLLYCMYHNTQYYTYVAIIRQGLALMFSSDM